MKNVNAQLLQRLSAGLGEQDADAVSDYICAIVGTEHYNDNLRQLRGTFGFAIPDLAGPPIVLPVVGTTARAFETTVADGGALDPNQGGLTPLNSGAANLDGGEIDGEELWILLGMGIEVNFPLAPAQPQAAATFPQAVSWPQPAAMQRLGRAVSISIFSNSRAMNVGTVADWPSSRGAAAQYRNGFTDNGSRSFRPIALKPSTRFHVEGKVVAPCELVAAPDSGTANLQLVTFTVTFKAWRINIRETFGGAQCANLFR